MLKPIFTAFQFITILPLPAREITPSDLGRAVGWFPLVGLGIAAFLAAVDELLARVFPPGVVVVIIMSLWLLLSGAIHFDGFLDSCDGLFGGKTPQQRLDIMRDHRVGAFAVAGGGLFLLLRYSALLALPDRTLPLLLAPVLGRWAAALAIVLFPYARDEGLGRAMKDHAHWPQALLATAIAGGAAWGLGGWQGGVSLVAAGLGLALVATFILRRIPGLTGDSYGAIIELTETLVLVLFSALKAGFGMGWGW